MKILAKWRSSVAVGNNPMRHLGVEEMTGAQHLHIAVAPEAVTDALIRLAVA
jgi:hypothetical protein